MDRILINDIHLSYEVRGTGKPILFLHGAYLSKKEWSHQLDEFAKDYQVIAMDLPGHGASDKLARYSVEVMAEYIFKFIEVVRITSCIICGHSLGGMVAQVIAQEHPNVVEKVILADTSFGVRSTVLESILTSLSMPIMKLISVDGQAKLFSDQMGKHDRNIKEYVLYEIKSHAHDKKNYHMIWDAVTAFKNKENLTRITCPTLILVGERNKQTHKQAKYMVKTISQSELVYIRDASHMLNMDNAVEFNQSIKEFIRG